MWNFLVHVELSAIWVRPLGWGYPHMVSASITRGHPATEASGDWRQMLPGHSWLDVHPQTHVLSRLEQLMNCDPSRPATNFGAFLSQPARVYKVYLAAFSLPRLWGNGLPLSQHCNVMSQCSNSVEGLKQCTVFQQLHEGYDRGFWFVFLLLEAL